MKMSKKDKISIQNAYYKKIEEYSKLTLEEIEELYPKLGGTYKIACNHVINQKLTDLRHELQDKENTTNLETVIDEIEIKNSNEEEFQDFHGE